MAAMTPQQLEMMKLRMRTEALQVLIHGLYTAIAGLSLSTKGAMLQRLGELRTEHSKIALKGYPPELSDLISGEYQDALDWALKSIETSLRS